MACATASGPSPLPRLKSVLPPRDWNACCSVAKSRLIRPVRNSIDQIDFTPRPIHSSARAKGIEHARVVAALLQQDVVGQGDDRVADPAQRGEALLGLLQPPAALETERHGDKGDDERALLRRHLGHDRGGAAARAARPCRRAGTRGRNPCTTAAIFSRSASAASRPRAGSPPAPRPRVTPLPMSTLSCTGDVDSAWRSVLMTASWSRSRFSILSRSTALEPAPPTPTQLDGDGPVGEDLVRQRQLVVVGIELHGSAGVRRRLMFWRKPPERRAAEVRSACALSP